MTAYQVRAQGGGGTIASMQNIPSAVVILEDMMTKWIETTFPPVLVGKHCDRVVVPPPLFPDLRHQKHVGDIHFKSENVLGGAELRNFLEIMLQEQNLELLSRRTEEMIIKRLASEMVTENAEAEVAAAAAADESKFSSPSCRIMSKAKVHFRIHLSRRGERVEPKVNKDELGIKITVSQLGLPGKQKAFNKAPLDEPAEKHGLF